MPDTDTPALSARLRHTPLYEGHGEASDLPEMDAERVCQRTDAPLTLDGAISHAEDVAQACGPCAAEHRQLAEWLRDYRALSAQVEALTQERDAAISATADLIEAQRAENERLTKDVQELSAAHYDATEGISATLAEAALAAVTAERDRMRDDLGKLRYRFADLERVHADITAERDAALAREAKLREALEREASWNEAEAEACYRQAEWFRTAPAHDRDDRAHHREMVSRCAAAVSAHAKSSRRLRAALSATAEPAGE